MAVIGIFLYLGALLSLSSIVESQATAGEGSSFSLYAYGEGIGGLPVIYYEGRAFVGNITDSVSAPFVNITFQIPQGNSTIEAIPVSEAFNETQYLAIQLSDGAYEQVRISHSPFSNETTTGFRLFGQDLVRTRDTRMTGNWYVTPEANETSLYALRWNSNRVDDGYSKPVGLRTVAPTA